MRKKVNDLILSYKRVDVQPVVRARRMESNIGKCFPCSMCKYMEQLASVLKGYVHTVHR